MAHSPAVLGGYLQLSRAMGRPRSERRGDRATADFVGVVGVVGVVALNILTGAFNLLAGLTPGSGTGA
ncbi:hypothetical protein [Streptomyces sp. NPDC003032]